MLHLARTAAAPCALLLPPRGLEGAAWAPVDWTAIGLMLAIVGGFLLANAILFRHPRSLVREYFGQQRPALHSIQSYIFQRVQVHLGFLLLLCGFVFELVGRLGAPVPAGQPFPALAAGLILVVTLVLEFGAWFWARRQMRHYVRAHLRERPTDFETDPRLAREVGELFDLPPLAEEAVQGYVARLRRELGLKPPLRPGRETADAPGIDDD